MININSYNVLTIYGAAVVFSMMLFYALESRSHWFTFFFGISCIASAVYG